jgi:hypothetical protein
VSRSWAIPRPRMNDLAPNEYTLDERNKNTPEAIQKAC